MVISERSLLISIAFLFLGCYTPKKADKQLDKVMNNYPEKVAALSNDKFPCVTKSDTVVTVEYDFIEVLDTTRIVDTLEKQIISTDTIIKKKIIKMPKEIVYITKYVKDSAKIASLESELRKCHQILPEKEEKTNIPKILALLLALLALVVYFVAKKK